MSTFNADNPQYASHFCPIHTKEWYDNKVKLDDIKQQSNTLLARVALLLEQFSSDLTPETLAQINAAVATLESAMAGDNYEGIATAYHALLELNNLHLEPLAVSVGEN